MMQDHKFQMFIAVSWTEITCLLMTRQASAFTKRSICKTRAMSLTKLVSPSTQKCDNWLQDFFKLRYNDLKCDTTAAKHIEGEHSSMSSILYTVFELSEPAFPGHTDTHFIATRSMLHPRAKWDSGLVKMVCIA